MTALLAIGHDDRARGWVVIVRDGNVITHHRFRGATGEVDARRFADAIA